MESFITSLPNTFLGWAAVITLVIFGIFAIIGLFDKRSKERKKDSDISEDRLIDILKKTVDELEIKVNKQTKDIEDLTHEVEELRKDNRKYIEIFQGRDQETKEYFRKGSLAMETIKDSHDILTTMAKSIEDTNKAMLRLIDVVEKLSA